jgi:hypothetical protein
MEITTKRINILFVIAFVVVLYFFFNSYFLDPQFNDRDGQRPREGISIGRNDSMNITRFEFYIVNARETDSIELRYSADFLEPDGVGKVGIFFPYKVKMITNSTGWDGKYVESGTVFMKKYTCNKEIYCKRNFFEQPQFEIIHEKTKFDSKNRYKHVIKVAIDNTVEREPDDFFREYNLKSYPLDFGYNDSTIRQFTIIIPEEADSIHPLPIPDPDVFHNSGNDYGNAQLDWHLSKDSHAFFIDYEMPDERKKFEDSQLGLTVTGILMGIIVGGYGTAYALVSKKGQNSVIANPSN